MITEREVFEAMLDKAELRVGAPCSDFGTKWRNDNNYKGPLTSTAMGRDLWNKYCNDRYHYLKTRTK